MMTPLIVGLKKWREKRGLTQAELAEAVGVRQATISDIETGKSRRIDLDTIDSLARVLRCSPGDLLERVPERKRQRRQR